MDFNIHSPDWNVHCGGRSDSKRFERLVEDHHLILNNELEKDSWPTQRKRTSIIHLTFTITDMNVLDTGIINKKLKSPPNYEVIVYNLADSDRKAGSKGTSKAINE